MANWIVSASEYAYVKADEITNIFISERQEKFPYKNTVKYDVKANLRDGSVISLIRNLPDSETAEKFVRRLIPLINGNIIDVQQLLGAKED